jgi:hypothetical protein
MDEPAGGDPPQAYTAQFTLTAEGGNPSYDSNGSGSPPWSVVEQGTITFASLEPGNEDYGPGFVQTEFDASVDVYQHGSFSTLGLIWNGYATPTGMLLGFDIDQYNAQEFGVDDSTATSYVIDAVGNTPFTDSDTSAPTVQTGTVTATTQNNFTTTGADIYTVHIEGTGTTHQVTWGDAITSTTTGGDTGTDTDSSAAPGTDTDSFNDTSTDTHTETDQTVGTLNPDGTFQLTSFSIDSTDDTDFADYLNGTATTPESGGGEADSFNNDNFGHDHEHLVVSGTPDTWTASLDDTNQGNFTDSDTGSESSSQTASGTTDTNQDGFNSGDSGTHTDTLHIDGSGGATTFTANTISDRIEDNYTFTDADDGNSGDTVAASTTPAETDADHYHATDTGTADEVLTITGDANTLTAGYTDAVHDGFTDSDDTNDTWSGPDSAGTGTDSGSDHSTDGDNGSEDVNLSANASLANWQADSTSSDAPTWQVTSVGGDVTGTAAVNAGDNGTDTDVAAANTSDTDYDHYVDNSTGTDAFQYHMAGDGTTAMVQQTNTDNLTNHSTDDNTAGWSDPTVLAGETAVDRGSEEIDDIRDDTAVLTVSQQSAIDAAGNQTVTSSHVDVQDSSSDNETDNGTDDASAAGVDDQGSITDTYEVGGTAHLHIDAAGGATTVSTDLYPTGTIQCGGVETDTNDIDPADTDTDTGAGTLGGAVSGDLHQAGTVAGNQLQLTTDTGGLTLNLNGSSQNTSVQVIDATPDAEEVTPAPRQFDVSGLAGQYTGMSGDPANADQIFDSVLQTGESGGFLGASAHVTVTRTVSVPSFRFADSETESAESWTVAGLTYRGTTIQTTALDGSYDTSLSHADATLTYKETTTDADGASAFGPTVAQATTSKLDVTIDSSQGENDNHFAGHLRQSVAARATFGQATATAQGGWVTVRERADEDGTSHWWGSNVNTPDEGPGGGDYDQAATHDYHERDSVLVGGTPIISSAQGTDSWTGYLHSYVGDYGNSSSDTYTTVNKQQDYTGDTAVNTVDVAYTYNDHLLVTATDPDTGAQRTLIDSNDPPVSQPGQAQSEAETQGYWQKVLSSPTAIRIFGGIRLVAGTIEAVGGLAVGITTAEVGGAFFAAVAVGVGVDDAQTGWAELLSGEQKQSARAALVTQLTGSPTAGVVADVLAPGAAVAAAGRFNRSTRAVLVVVERTETVTAAGARARSFPSFSALKRALGPAGPGKVWHHVVEQRTTNIAQFGAGAIHNTSNVVAVTGDVNQKIANFYSSIRRFSGGQTVRQWLGSQSFAEQDAFGRRILDAVLNNRPLPP